MFDETPKDSDLLVALTARRFTIEQQTAIVDGLDKLGWISPAQAKERLDAAYVASLPAMEPRMVWQVAKADDFTLGIYLTEGWEPFAVTEAHGKAHMYHLRRQVAAV